jgi:hypothetical protein
VRSPSNLDPIAFDIYEKASSGSVLSRCHLLNSGNIVVTITLNGKCGPSMHELLDMGYEFTLDGNLQEDLPQCNPC